MGNIVKPGSRRSPATVAVDEQCALPHRLRVCESLAKNTNLAMSADNTYWRVRSTMAEFCLEQLSTWRKERVTKWLGDEASNNPRNDYLLMLALEAAPSPRKRDKVTGYLTTRLTSEERRVHDEERRKRIREQVTRLAPIATEYSEWDEWQSDFGVIYLMLRIADRCHEKMLDGSGYQRSAARVNHLRIVCEEARATIARFPQEGQAACDRALFRLANVDVYDVLRGDDALSREALEFGWEVAPRVMRKVYLALESAREAIIAQRISDTMLGNPCEFMWLCFVMACKMECDNFEALDYCTEWPRPPPLPRTPRSRGMSPRQREMEGLVSATLGWNFVCATPIDAMRDVIRAHPDLICTRSVDDSALVRRALFIAITDPLCCTYSVVIIALAVLNVCLVERKRPILSVKGVTRRAAQRRRSLERRINAHLSPDLRPVTPVAAIRNAANGLRQRDETNPHVVNGYAPVIKLKFQDNLAFHSIACR
jgi:hypothetical protein